MALRGEITGFVRSYPGTAVFYHKPVYLPDSIDAKYDYILVASLYGDEIYKAIQSAGIALDKVCFISMPKLLADAEHIQSNVKKAAQFSQFESDTGNEELAGLFCFQKKGCAEPHETDLYTGKLDENDNAPLGYYFYQDLWAARLVNKNNPGNHYDIGSKIDGFIAHLLSFRESVTMIDVRPFPLQIPGLNFTQADATNLDTIEDDSIESLSALCSLEHFGLGRYGDPVDPEACFKAFSAIQKKIAPGGSAYIAVPVGLERLMFNANRIFYAKTILEAFSEMDLVEFSATDGCGIEYNVPLDKYDLDDSRNSVFGLFWFRKPEA